MDTSSLVSRIDSYRHSQRQKNSDHNSRTKSKNPTQREPSTGAYKTLNLDQEDLEEIVAALNKLVDQTRLRFSTDSGTHLGQTLIAVHDFETGDKILDLTADEILSVADLENIKNDIFENLSGNLLSKFV